MPNKKLFFILLPILVGIVAGAAILAVNPNAGQKLGDFLYSQGVSAESYAYAVNKAAPSVVNIYVASLKDDYASPDNSAITTSASGVIMSSDGYIVTNYHVVPSGNEPSKAIWAQTRSGKLYQAFVIGYDRRTDIAVLKVEAKDLPPIELASKESQVGDIVLAIGNPNNLGQTVTHGIISAVARSGSGLLTRDQMNIRDGLQDLIQTDAPINSGNSGGALIDTAGTLVGINTASFNGYQTYGIGFAVPSELVRSIMGEIISHGKVIRGYLGIADDERSSFEKSLNGVRIGYIDPQGPAFGHLQLGDIIKQVNGTPVSEVKELIQLISGSKPGTKMNFVVDRGGNLMNIEVTLVEDRNNID